MLCVIVVSIFFSYFFNWSGEPERWLAAMTDWLISATLDIYRVNHSANELVRGDSHGNNFLTEAGC
jgi:hypothetical protein